MAINPALLICCPLLQDYFSDNATDAAMSAGVITCYQDNSRTTLKNWYYQTGSPGAYTYTQLPNPLTLSAAGTITDAMGNDTIPFWYPYSETDNETFQPYYVTVDNSNGQRQFTRQNFPFVPQNTTPISEPTFKNLIVNNVFWRNVGSINLTNIQSTVLAPSQHDGFASNMADILFIKNANGATDTATFTTFSNINRLTGDATPEFYLNMTSGNSGTSETTKYIQIPICLHVDNLSGYPTASVSIWAQNVGGASNNKLTLTLLQYLGTGVTSPTANPIATIVPNTSWTKYTFQFAFPVATLPPGGPGDDGWFLQIGYPVGVQYNMNIAKPSVYLSEQIPNNDLDTYEYVSGTIDSPRTGDIRTSINTYYPYGWVPLNNGTIGNASSNATGRANIDTWPLFSLLWQTFNAYTNGTTNVLAQMVNSSGTHVAYGASAIADWNANNSIALTQTMGRVLLGTVPPATETNVYSTTFTGSNSAGNILLTIGNNVAYFNGMPVYVTTTGTLPDSLAANTIYWVSNFNGTNAFNLSTTFANAMAGTVIAYGATNGSNCSVVAALINSQEGEYAHTQLLAELAAHTHTVTPIGNANSASTGHITMLANNDNQTSTTFNTGSTGSSTPFNVTQPGVFVNMYMKL